MNLDKSFLAIVVVSIDNGERLLDDILAGQNCLAGAPGLAALSGNFVPGGDGVLLLESIGNLNAQVGTGLFNAVADGFLESLLNVVADDKDNLVKPGFDGIMDGVIHDDLAVGADSGQLLDAAAKAGADAGCHNAQCCFHTFSS